MKITTLEISPEDVIIMSHHSKMLPDNIDEYYNATMKLLSSTFKKNDIFIFPRSDDWEMTIIKK